MPLTKPTLHMHTLTRKVLGMMGVFGGVEALNLLCSVVRTKLVAIWIGAAGVGLFGLFNAAIEMMCTLSQLGLRTSSVKDIASASGAERSLIIRVVRRCARWMALAGAVLTVVLSPILSRVTFGSLDYMWAFMALAAVVALNCLVAGEGAVLQGLGRLKVIARASVYSVTVSLIVSLPIIYFLRINGVVPVIIVYSAVTATVYALVRERGVTDDSELTYRQTWEKAKGLIKLGAFLTISGFVTWAVSYIIMSYINHAGGESEMGYYQSGFTLSVRYAGIVFTALGMEYFPRISSVAQSGVKRLTVMLRHQSRVVLWVVTLLACGMAVAAPWIVRLLYSGDFLAVVPMVVMASPGLVLRGVSWTMAFVIIAKGDGRVYLLTELTSGIMCLVLNIAGYSLYGLPGVGFAFSVWYALYALIVWGVLRKRYGIHAHVAVPVLVAVSTVSAVVGLAYVAGVWSLS